MPASPPPRSSHFVPAGSAASSSSASSSSANHGHAGPSARPSGSHPHSANYHHRPPPLPPPPRPASSLQPLSEQSLSFMFQVHMPDEEHGPYHPLAPGELPRLRTEIDTLLKGGRARTADLEREIANIDAWIAAAQARSNAASGTRPPVSASSSQSAGKLVGMTSTGLPMPHRPRTSSSSSRPPLPPPLSLSAASSSSSLNSTSLSAAASLSAVAPPILSPRSAALAAASLPPLSASHGSGAGKNVATFAIPPPLRSTPTSSGSTRLSMSPPPHSHTSTVAGSSLSSNKKRKYDHGSSSSNTSAPSGATLSTNPMAASGSASSSASSTKPPGAIKLKIKLGQPTAQPSTVPPLPHAPATAYATGVGSSSSGGGGGNSSGGYIPPPPTSTTGVVPPPQPYHTHPHIPPPTLPPPPSGHPSSTASQPPPPKRKRLDKPSRASSVSSLPNASPALSSLPGASSSFSHLPSKPSSSSSAHRRASLSLPHLHLPTDTPLYTGPTPVLPPPPPKGVTHITHVDRPYYHQNYVPDFDGVPAVEELQGADYSRPPPPNKVQNTPASTFWGYLDQWLRAVTEEDVIGLGVAVPGAAAAAAAALKAAKAKEAAAASGALLAPQAPVTGAPVTGPDAIAQALAAFHALHTSPVTASAAAAAGQAAASLAATMEPGAYFGVAPDLLAGIDKTDLKYFLVPALGAHPPATRPSPAHAAPPVPAGLFSGGRQGGATTSAASGAGAGADVVTFDASANPTRPAVLPGPALGKVDKAWYAEQRAPPLLDRLLGALVPDPIAQAAATAVAAAEEKEDVDAMDVDEASEDEPGMVRVKHEAQPEQEDVGLVSVPVIDPELNPYARAAAALFMASAPASVASAASAEGTVANKQAVPKFAIEKLQERLVGELMALGIVKPGEPTPTGAAHADDQIASHLRAAQHALRTQLAINRARKVRLMHLARQRLAYQEYRAVLDDVDRQLEAAYADRYLPKPPPKKGKKSKAGSSAAGGSGGTSASGGKASSVRDASPALGGDASRGGSPAPGAVAGRPPVPAEVVQLIEKRKWLVKHVGALFKEKADEYYESPSVSIYPDLPDNVGADPKTGKLIVPKGPIPSGAWPPKVPRASTVQQVKAEPPRDVGNAKVKAEPGSVVRASSVVLPGTPMRSPSPVNSRPSSTSPTFPRMRSVSGSVTSRDRAGAAGRMSRSPSAMEVDVAEVPNVDDADADSIYEQEEDDDEDDDGSPLPVPAGRRRSTTVIASPLLASDGLESSPLPGRGGHGFGGQAQSPLREHRG